MRYPITKLQSEIYLAWLACDRKFKVTAKHLNRKPEQIRQVVAKVLRKIGEGHEI